MESTILAYGIRHGKQPETLATAPASLLLGTRVAMDEQPETPAAEPLPPGLAAPLSTAEPLPRTRAQLHIIKAALMSAELTKPNRPPEGEARSRSPPATSSAGGQPQEHPRRVPFRWPTATSSPGAQPPEHPRQVPPRWPSTAPQPLPEPLPPGLIARPRAPSTGPRSPALIAVPPPQQPPAAEPPPPGLIAVPPGLIAVPPRLIAAASSPDRGCLLEIRAKWARPPRDAVPPALIAVPPALIAVPPELLSRDAFDEVGRQILETGRRLIEQASLLL